MPGQLESMVVRGDYAGNSDFTCKVGIILIGEISENIDTIDCDSSLCEVKHLTIMHQKPFQMDGFRDDEKTRRTEI